MMCMLLSGRYKHKLIIIGVDMILRYIICAMMVSLALGNPCALAITPHQCSQCSQGYFLATNYTCMPCPIGCAQCLSSANCVTCQPNYFLTNLLCQAGPQNCLIVNNNGDCTQCLLGYYLNQVECTPCPNFCIACTNSSCSQCSSGFGINLANNSCYLCGGACTSCQYQNDQSVCLQCPVGYYVAASTCEACEPNCVNCTNAATCITCALGYFPEGNACVACPTGCVTCNNNSSCSSCQQGYFLNPTQQCLACSSQCNSCSSADNCTTCAVGYYNNQGSCSSCGSPCAVCNGPNQCTNCSGSHYSNNGICELCPLNCATCTDPFPCLTCTSNSYAVSNGDCMSCSSLITGCLTCSSSIYCLTCSDDYDLLEGSCLSKYSGLSAGYIVLIVAISLLLSGAIGYAIYSFWKKRRGFMGPQSSSQQSGLRATYYQIP